MKALNLLLLIVIAVVSAGAQTSTPTFEVASIKPNKSGDGSWSSGCANGGALSTVPAGRCMATDVSLKILIATAYNISIFSMDQHIQGMPAGMSERYDVDAKAESASATEAELRLMLQAMLADRFKLKLHEETRDVGGYVLVVAKGGPKLKTPEEYRRNATGTAPIRLLMGAHDASMLATMLSGRLGQPVVDRTNITGNYVYNLEAPSPDDPSPPSIFTALQEQLGLKLESQKVPLKVLVIDHAERPSEN